VNTLALDYRYQPRDPTRRVKGMLIVIALHALLGYALVSGMARQGLNLIKKPLAAVVIQEVILPPPPPPPLPAPPKEIKTPEPLAPKTETTPPPLQPDLPAPPAMSPVEPPQRDVPAPTKPTPVTMAAPAPLPMPDNTKAQAASLESEYAGKVRAMLNATKRYPTGRAASQQRPQGRVKVWFTLGRGGALLEAGVLESSNSNLLDDAAMATVRRGVYPPFPANTWLDQESHKFSAEIEFNPPSA